MKVSMLKLYLILLRNVFKFIQSNRPNLFDPEKLLPPATHTHTHTHTLHFKEQKFIKRVQETLISVLK
jgi:hypothetical protein